MVGVRAFIALELPDATRDELVTVGGAIRALDRRWVGEKWVAPCNLHVTLRFLGDITAADVEVLRAALDLALPSAGCVELAGPRVTAVPGRRHARMLWVTFLDVGGRCAALAEAASRAALRIGVPPDERPFIPHVTLVRSRRPVPIAELALTAAQRSLEGLPGPMSVGKATLYESVLTRHGPVYEALAVWRLGSR